MDETPTAPPPSRASFAWLPRVLVESVLIVFSVLLALAVDEWRDERALRARNREAVAAIVAELDANRRAAERAKGFHEKIHAELKAFAARHETPSAEFLSRGVFQPAVLLQSAWMTARETGALAPLPLDVMLRLSRVYERQAGYMELSTRIATEFYADVRRRGADIVLLESYPGFSALTLDFSNREAGLIQSYDDTRSMLAALPQ